jgi:hypothetical protein
MVVLAYSDFGFDSDHSIITNIQLPHGMGRLSLPFFLGTITRTLDGCSLFVVRDPPIRSVSWLQHPNCIGTKKALRAGTLESRKGFALSTRGFSASDVSSASLFSPFADGIGLAPIPGHPTAEALARTAPHRRGVPP